MGVPREKARNNTRSGSGVRVHTTTRIPMAFASSANRRPIPPKPTTPIVRPLSSTPIVDWFQRPARSSASRRGTWRAAANSSASACSATVLSEYPGQLQTVIPLCAANSVALRAPE